MGQLLSVTVTTTIVGLGHFDCQGNGDTDPAATRCQPGTGGSGVCNIVSSFSQGYAVSGSFSRSAVVTGVVVAITPLLYHLPQATLAAVIIMAVINLVKVDR